MLEKTKRIVSMATRNFPNGRIGILNENGVVANIYCDNVSGIEYILLNYYNTENSCRFGIAMGSAVTWTPVYSNIIPYSSEKVVFDNTIDSFLDMENKGVEFLFLFANNQWFMKSFWCKYLTPLPLLIEVGLATKETEP